VKVDVHNHGVPETVLDFFADHPEFGIEITADHHIERRRRRGVHARAAFYDADAKVANLEEHGLDGGWTRRPVPRCPRS